MAAAIALIVAMPATVADFVGNFRDQVGGSDVQCRSPGNAQISDSPPVARNPGSISLLGRRFQVRPRF